MNILRLKYFIEVAKCKNFTKAAQLLYTSQPNLSKQIALMENELGFKLFCRSNNKFLLTEEGSYLYEQLKDIPDLINKTFEHCKSINMGREGAISVGILEGQDVNLILAERLKSINKQYPNITLNLERDCFSNLLRGLENHYYDIIITISFELKNTLGLCYETLIEQKAALAVNRKNPKSELLNPTLSDFKDEDFVCISAEESQAGYELFLNQCDQSGFKPRVVKQTRCIETLLLCVETGIGISLFDRNTRLEKNSDVRIIPLPNSSNADIVAVWLETNKNPAIQQLVEGLKEKQVCYQETGG